MNASHLNILLAALFLFAGTAHAAQHEDAGEPSPDVEEHVKHEEREDLWQVAPLVASRFGLSRPQGKDAEYSGSAGGGILIDRLVIDDVFEVGFSSIATTGSEGFGLSFELLTEFPHHLTPDFEFYVGVGATLSINYHEELLSAGPVGAFGIHYWFAGNLGLAAEVSYAYLVRSTELSSNTHEAGFLVGPMLKY